MAGREIKVYIILKIRQDFLKYKTKLETFLLDDMSKSTPN